MYGDWRLIRSWSSPSVIVTSSIRASGAASSSAACGGAAGAAGPPGAGLGAGPGAVTVGRTGTWGAGAGVGASRFWHPGPAPNAVPPTSASIARSRIFTTGSGSTGERVQQGPPGPGRTPGLGRRDRVAPVGQLAPAAGEQRAGQRAGLGQRDRDPRRADLERQHAGAARDRLDPHQLAEQRDVARDRAVAV